MTNILNQIREAMMWLTRLPLNKLGKTNDNATDDKAPSDHKDKTKGGHQLDQALWVFPLVGAFVGLIVALIIGGGYYLLAIPSFPMIIIGVIFGIFLTGALHEDGLADCADGFGVIGPDKEKRLSVMRDSHIGTFGVLALMAAFTMKIFLVEYILIEAPYLFLATITLAGAASRAVIPFALKMAPIADEKSSAYGIHPNALTLAIILAIVIVPSIALIGLLSGPIAIIGAFIFVPLLAFWAKHAIGGVSGDVCGALAIISELGFLLCFSITL